MDGKTIKLCPFHKDLKIKVEEHDRMIHKLDKQLARFTIVGSLNLLAMVVIIVKLFIG